MRTPNEEDFCECGWTFQPIGKTKARKCPGCGTPEWERKSWHERTGQPYQNIVPLSMQVGHEEE